MSPAGRGARILFVTDADSFGGAEIALATLLSKLHPRFEAQVAGYAPDVLERIAAARPRTGVAVLPPVRARRDPASFLRLVRELRAIAPDILHANLNGPGACRHAIAAAWAARSIRTVAVEHLPYPLEGRWDRGTKRFTSRTLAAHVTVGRQLARDLEAMFSLPSGSVRTIYNGVPDVPLRKVERRGQQPVIGAIGRLHRQKGLDVLIRALSSVPGCDLVLVGDGEEREALERLTAELGLEDRIDFAGYRADGQDLLTSFDILAMPSRFEGLPLAVLQGMLARLPVVATPVGSMAEAVRPGETGLLVPPDQPQPLAEALSELIRDPALRRSMGERAREVALEFSPEAMAADYERLYDEVLAAPVPALRRRAARRGPR